MSKVTCDYCGKIVNDEKSLFYDHGGFFCSKECLNNYEEENASNYVECSCGHSGEIPADEQRWHMADFEWIKNNDEDGEENGTATYKCNICGEIVRSKIIIDEVGE